MWDSKLPEDQGRLHLRLHLCLHWELPGTGGDPDDLDVLGNHTDGGDLGKAAAPLGFSAPSGGIHL